MKSLQNNFRKGTNRGTFWAWFVFFSQIPFVFWYAQGGLALHPIVVMLPLVGILNFSVEKQDRGGLGLTGAYLGWSGLVALIYAGFSILGRMIAYLIDGVQFAFHEISIVRLSELAVSFLVGVFILALWEEIVNRGFIQTRLQAAWGFWGVIVTTLLFAAMHIPSALLDYKNELAKVAIRFVETGLAGFVFGYVYWRTRSVLAAIAIHGLHNFAVTGILPLLTGISVQQVFPQQASFLLLWTVGQVMAVVLVARRLFNASLAP